MVPDDPAAQAAKAFAQEMSELDVDDLSPREALAQLYALQEKAKQALS